MSLRSIRVVYRKELTEMLRDRRTIISMVVLPLLLFPVMVLGIGSLASSLMGNAKKEVPKVMVAGGQDSPRLMEKLRASDQFQFEPAQPDYVSQISEKKIRAVMVVPAGFDAAEESGAAQTITIDYYEGDMSSSLAADKLETYLDKLRDQAVKERLVARHVPVAVLEPFRVEQKNVAPPEKVAGATLGGMVPYLVIIMCFTGAMYPAMDMTAGEKGAWHAGNAVVQPRFADRPGAGEISDGADGVTDHGDAGGPLHGNFVSLRAGAFRFGRRRLVHTSANRFARRAGGSPDGPAAFDVFFWRAAGRGFVRQELPRGANLYNAADICDCDSRSGLVAARH